ncbi:MAG: hypothetical protein K2W96_06375 [Gemmataceae bacterium]|nr:hypothetical protein [Gemmataceae bacterium]
MGMIFPYRQMRAIAPVIALGGRLTRPKPIITATLIGPMGTHVDGCLVDDAADDTVFPDWVAAKIGIDLSNAPIGAATGISLAHAPIRYARAVFRISAQAERREWEAWVGFTSARMRWPLLGFAGFLQFLTATFDGEGEKLELAVNGLYPGT